jgi:RNA polymerase sigma-70 factor, ECF subfamily
VGQVANLPAEPRSWQVGNLPHGPLAPATMDEQREREVATGLRAGKPEAWHALYDEYARPIWQAVSRRLGPREVEVADVVQEIFMAAARGARGYDGSRGSLGMWLGGIARNCVALHFRRKKRQETAGAGGDGAATANRLLPWLERRHDDPAAALESAELAERVRATLTALPRDYETLLVTKYIDEASVEQMAAAEKATPVAIRSKLARARQAFRELFTSTQAHPSESEDRVR